MAGYIEHIIKHSFNPFVDFAKAIQHCEELIEKVCASLSIDRSSAYFEIDDDIDSPNIRISLSTIGDLNLMNGFIEIQLGIKEQMFWGSMEESMPDFIRLKKIALVLGATEVWHVQDCYTWDADFDYTKMTFEEWFSKVTVLVNNNVVEYKNWQGDFKNKPIILHQKLLDNARH